MQRRVPEVPATRIRLRSGELVFSFCARTKKIPRGPRDRQSERNPDIAGRLTGTALPTIRNPAPGEAPGRASPVSSPGMPKVTAIEIVEDRTAASRCDEGFLRLKRYRARNRHPDGTASPVYPVDVIDR